jgi:hypothetical protein
MASDMSEEIALPPPLGVPPAAALTGLKKAPGTPAEGLFTDY